MAPTRVAIAATAVLCLLEYGLTADIKPTATMPEATTKIAADTGGTTLLNTIGKRQAHDSTTAVAPTGVPIAMTTERSVPPGKRQVTYGPTTVFAINTATSATIGTTNQQSKKRQVSGSPTTTEIVTPTATVSNQPSIAPTVNPSNQAGKRQAPYSSSHSPTSSGTHDHDHDHDNDHDDYGR